MNRRHTKSSAAKVNNKPRPKEPGRPFIPSGNPERTFNTHAQASARERQAQLTPSGRGAGNLAQQSVQARQAQRNDNPGPASGPAPFGPVTQQQERAGSTILHAYRKSKFLKVVNEAVDTRRQQIASPLVNANRNDATAHAPGGAGRAYTTDNDGNINQITLYNKQGDLSEQIDFAAHENGKNLSGHHHVADTPGDIASSRGRDPGKFREAHNPAATMDARVWAGAGQGNIPNLSMSPGSAGQHSPNDKRATRVTQMGSLVADDKAVVKAMTNKNPGSSHAQQRAAYLSKLK